MASAEPLLEAPDLETGLASQESEGEAVPEEQPQRPPVFRDICCFLPMGSIYHYVQRNMLPSTPGYAWSVLSRRWVRALTTLAVFIAAILAEGMESGFNYWLVLNNLIFGLLLLFAGFVPAFRDPAPSRPDIFLGLAAAVHTWRAAWHVVGTDDEGSPAWERRNGLCSEHLAMFWIIVLVTMCGTETLAVGTYGAALIVLQQTTGVPGVPCFLAAFCILVPAYLAERIWCSACAELHRCRLAINKLLKRGGGAWLSISIESGHVVESSPGLEAYMGPMRENTHLTELVRLPKDRQILDQLITGCSLAAAGAAAATFNYRGLRCHEYTTLVEETIETALAPRDVSSLRCLSCPKGVQAKIVPYKLSLDDKRLSIWVGVDTHAIQHTDPRLELATREKVVAVREHDSSLKQTSLEMRERGVEELEQALSEMHQRYLEALAEKQQVVQHVKHQEDSEDEEKA